MSAVQLTPFLLRLFALAGNIVILSGTNGASYLYHEIASELRARGFCTLLFDPRAHGRSENAPGVYTAELLGEDAAAIIRIVFEDKPVHILGWSLGGALGYYLAIEHPDLVASLTISGMSSCFGRPLLADGNCDTSVAKGLLNVLGALSLPSLLAGTAVQGQVASLPFLFGHQTTDDVMKFFWFQETAAFTRTPAVSVPYLCPTVIILAVSVPYLCPTVIILAVSVPYLCPAVIVLG